MFVAGELLDWLCETDMDDSRILGLSFSETNLFWCGTKYFLRYYGKFVSCWLTVAITVERYVLIALPLQASTISTKRVTLITIATIYALGFVLFLFPYWEFEIVSYEDPCTKYKYCTYSDPHRYQIYNWVLIRVGSLVLPCALIFLFTVLIVRNLRENQRTRREMTNDTSEVKAVEKQLTLMLIVVAVATLALRLPYTIVYAIYSLSGPEYGTWTEFYWLVAKDICYTVAAINYMINFFLFCLTGSIFRKNLKNCLLGRWLHKEQATYHSDCTKATTVRSTSNSMTSLQRLRAGGSSISVNVGRHSVTPQGTPQTLRAQQDTPLLLKRNENALDAGK